MNKPEFRLTRRHNATIDFATKELVVRYRNHEYRTAAGFGCSDDVDVFRILGMKNSGMDFVVVVRNERFGYLGVDVYDFQPPESEDYETCYIDDVIRRLSQSFFCQDTEQIIDMFGCNVLDEWNDMSIARWAVQFWIDNPDI